MFTTSKPARSRKSMRGRSQSNTFRRRRQTLEQLEQRQLLAGDLNANQSDNLDAGLADLQRFVQRVQFDDALLGRDITGIGQNYRQLFDFASRFQSEIVAPMQLFLDGATTDEAVLTELQNQSGVVTATLVPAGGNGDAVVFDTTLYLSQSVPYQPDWAESAAEIGLRFGANVESTVEMGFTFDIQFGLDSNNAFFTKIERLELGVVDAVQVIATGAIPAVSSLDRDVTFSLLINDASSVTATLPANTPGNLTPLPDRINRALQQPLIDAGFLGDVKAIEQGGRLAIRATSPSIESLELSGGETLQLLGFQSEQNFKSYDAATGVDAYSPAIDYGLLSLQSTGGVTMDGAVAITAAAGANARLDGNEFDEAAFSSTSTGFVQGEWAVRPSTQSLFDGSPLVTARSNTLFRLDEAVVATESFVELDDLHDQVTLSLTDGLGAIAQFGDRLATETEFGGSLPGVFTTIEELSSDGQTETTRPVATSLAREIDLEATLRSKLQSRVEVLLASNPRPSWSDVESALAADGDVTVTARDETNENLSLTVQLTPQQTSQQSLSLGDAAGDAGFAAAEDSFGEVDLTTQTDWTLQLDLDRGQPQSPLDAFSVRFVNARNTAIVDETLSGNANIGFLGVTAAGDLNMNANLLTQVGQAGESITAARLLSEPIETLAQMTASGTADASLAIQSVGGLVTLSDVALSMSVAGDELFSGAVELQPVNFDAVEDFVTVSPNVLIGGLRQLSDWLGEFAEQKLSIAAPLSESLGYDDLVDLKKVFDDLVLSQLTVDGSDQASFMTAQEFESLEFVSNASYVDDQLTFDLLINEAALTDLTDALAFNFELGDFAGMSVTSDLVLSPKIDFALTLGIDLRPLDADAASITTTTSVLPETPGAVNKGKGVLFAEGHDLVVSLRDGTVFTVDLSGSTTLGDVIDKLHASRDLAGVSAAEFVVSIRRENGKGVGLNVVDTSDDLGSVFSIQASGESLAGFGLGILGEVEPDADDESGQAKIEGQPLHGETFADRLFIQEMGDTPIAVGKVSLDGDVFNATANLGFTEVEIRGGEILDAAGVPSHFTAALDLPGENNRITVAELFDELETAIDATLDGSLAIKLPTFGTGSLAGNDDEGLIATLTSYGEGLAAEISGSIDGVLAQLSDVDAGDVLQGLLDGLKEFLSGIDIQLPVIDVSLPDAIGLDGLLDDLTEAIRSIGSSNPFEDFGSLTLDVLSEGVNRIAQIANASLDAASQLEFDKIDFPEIDISFSDLFQFFNQAKSIEPISDPMSADDGKFSLPSLNGIFADLFAFEVELPALAIEADDFDSFLGGVSGILDKLALSGPGSLQGISSKIEKAIGLPGLFVGLQVDTSGAELAVRFDLSFSKEVVSEYALNVDLSSLLVDGIGDLIDVGASSTLAFDANARVDLALGVEVGSGGVKPFLYTSGSNPTKLSVGAKAAAENLHFEAALGPFGIGVVGGVAGIGIPGASAGAPLQRATFDVTLVDADGRYFLFEDNLNFAKDFDGGAFVRLPLEAPLGSAPINIQMDVTDLADPTFQFGLWDENFVNPIDLDGQNGFDKGDVAQAIQDKIDNFGNVGDNLLAMVGGWEGAFDLLIDTMQGEVLGVPLPLIGDALAEQATFLEDIKNSVLENFNNLSEMGIQTVQNAMFEALDGLGLLSDIDADGDVDSQDIKYTPVANGAEFDIDLSKTYTAMLGGGFDLGLPGLNFDMDADVDLEFAFNFKLAFGVSLEDGFYLVTDESRTDLGIAFNAGVTNLDAGGQLAFLEARAVNKDGLPTRFVGEFDIDVTDDVSNANNNGRLSLSEMFVADFSEILTHRLNAEADVALTLEVSGGDTQYLPRLRADLIVDLNYGVKNDGSPADPNSVSFENVQMNLGDFFSGFAGTTLREVQKVLRPVQPIIDTLTNPIPVISDLGGRDVSLVDIARMFGRADVANFITSVRQINDLVTGLPPISSESWIDLGGFSVDAGSLGGYEGPGTTLSPMVKELKFDVTTVPTNSPLLQTENQGGGGWTNSLDDAKGDLSFPLLESPSTAFNLLLGRDVDLFLYDAPALGVDFRYEQSFPTPIPGLFATLGGRIAAVADFSFGFDTSGISRFRETGNSIDIFDGFFVSDRVNADGTGADVPEVYLRGALTAGAKVDFLIASAGVRGGIYADVDFNLHDNNQDGRVRAGEIIENFTELGPLHVFDVRGSVDVGLEAFLNVNLLLFQINETYQIASANLLDFEIARPSRSGPTATQVLTSRSPNAAGSGDILTLQFSQQADNFRVLPGSQAGSIVVQGNDSSGKVLITKDIVGISEIRGFALGGNDNVTISPDVTLPVFIDGGEGNDELVAGGGVTTFLGQAGDDRLTGGDRGDTLGGGLGNDVIVGGDGEDTISGGAGDDYIDGGRGEDHLMGGSGNDEINGDFGADDIDGGAGDDLIDGGRGADVIAGGVGVDIIYGGLGDDQIAGGAGDDELYGQEGADHIEGGEGNDLIEGGQRNDVLIGGGGDDNIDGGTGNDDISGGDGDDVISGGSGSDNIDAGAGDDLVYAGSATSNDDASSTHTIVAGLGDDTVFGSEGIDWIDAGDGNDVVSALAGGDVVIGGKGDDEIDGGRGNDLVWGGVAAYESAAFNLAVPGLFEEPFEFTATTNLVDQATGEVGYSDYSLEAQWITPAIVAGASVAGVAGDGRDTLRGGDGVDWLFGGSESDVIFGGGGADYIDGGQGDDDGLSGDEGDDVIRGGLGNDVVHGGLGIDQIYGDQGRDTLYGDGGINGSTDGQRLFGGDDVDSLFAWSADTTTVGGKGHQLFGGDGGDFLYGSLQNELLFGEGGADYLSGDWAAGPDYKRNTMASTLGGDDQLFGGGGQDQVYGGGGDDVIRGGGDGDWLEGQDGNDDLAGGGGIDFLVLDVNPNFSDVLDGHGSSIADDNATDILMINGTTGDDIIKIGSVGDRLRVEYNGDEILADWLSNGTPLVEQIRVAGLTGDDAIEFLASLDLSMLSARSRDFVTQIDGGPGDDRLKGSGARDRIDGGIGSDTIWGFAGDDRLWGDQGAEDGVINDADVIYAGWGNDDVLGGQGSNMLFAWSDDPSPGDFGIYRDEDGNLRPEDPALRDPNATYTLEDTGLNRIIGSAQDDLLYGGTGLDLLYGNGGNDVLFTRSGKTFESLDNGNGGVDWKTYARESAHAWYVGGSNANDVISVDFVTEPGILAGHHLVTRSTNNNGNFSFDAQVRLDFSATDDEGRLIWDPDQLFAGSADLQSDDPFERAAALNQKFSDAGSLSQLLPAEGDFHAIIIDALAGDDIVNVGPTVQKSVWVDAGDGDDRVHIASGRSILIDQTEQRRDANGNPVRNDDIGSPYALLGPAIIQGTAAPAANGQLDADASFYLIVDELEENVLVTVTAAMTKGIEVATAANASIQDLIDDINRQIGQTAASGLVVATLGDNSRIVLSGTSVSPTSRLAIQIPAGNAAATELMLPANEIASPGSLIAANTRYSGLTIDNPDDIDHYQFELVSSSMVSIAVSSIGTDDGMGFQVRDANGVIDPVDGRYSLSAGTLYTVSVESDSVPTIYELTIGLSGGAIPVVVTLGAVVDFQRRDVIFGGAGRDVLQGGPGEDFVFGGAGNDVLTGGDDRGASDLLFGDAGDDTFQSIPDYLPTLTGTDTTFLPTQSDRFDGGSGTDRLLYLGGDLDSEGRPIPDYVSHRYDRFLSRYELAALVWDTNNQRFVPASADQSDNGTSVRRWHFYDTVSVESTEFELMAGDDQYWGEEGFIFPGDQSGSEWGTKDGDIQTGASAFASIVVDGGVGNDTLIGGPTADRLMGGLGNDVITGGLGNDQIDGGIGDDLLAGTFQVAPDRFEFSTRHGQSVANNEFSFASELSFGGSSLGISGLSFHQGDSVDWYLLKLNASFGFEGEMAAAVRDQVFTIRDVQTGKTLASKLFLTESRGSGSEQVFVPVSIVRGASDALLLRVENRVEGEAEVSTNPRNYQIEWIDPIGVTVDVSVSRLVADPDRGLTREGTAIPATSQETLIPIGDFNGDGLNDFIVGIDQTSAQKSAQIVFGGDPYFDPGADAGTLARYTELTTMAGEIKVQAAGDIDGDGRDDLLVMVGRGTSAAEAFVVFGRSDVGPNQFGEIAVERDFSSAANVIHLASMSNSQANLFSAGDVNGDGLDDFLGTLADSTELFLGRERSGWFEPTNAYVSPFGASGLGGFTLSSDVNLLFHSGNGEWRNQSGRLIMGGGNYRTTRNAPFQGTIEVPTNATAISPLIDLSMLNNPRLSFDHLLETDFPFGPDRAEVLIEVDGVRLPLAQANNRFGRLTEGTGANRPMESLEFSLDPYAGKEIRIVFQFRSFSPFQNDFFGWAIDNVVVSGDQILSQPSQSVPLDRGLTGILNVTSMGDLSQSDDDAANDVDDLGIVIETGSGPRLLVYRGQTDTDFSSWSPQSTTPLFASDVRLTSRLNLDGNGFPDLLLSNGSESLLLLGDGDESFDVGTQQVAVSQGGLMAVGDVNGDGITDLAARAEEFTSTFEGEFNSGAPLPDELRHDVVQVFLSETIEGTVSWDRLPGVGGIAPASPTLILELPDSLFVDPATPPATSRWPTLGSMGDLNGDGFDDVGVYTAYRDTFHVVFGGSIEILTVDLNPIAVAAAVLATPMSDDEATVERTGLTLNQAENQTLANAYAIDGTEPYDRLGGGRPVGDINGDGDMDVAFTSESGTYIVFGPLDLNGATSILDLANIVIEDGFLIPGYGDAIGASGQPDGIDDLFVAEEFCAASCGNIVVNVYLGGSKWQRTLPAEPDAEYFQPGFQRRPSTLLDWNGDGVIDLLWRDELQTTSNHLHVSVSDGDGNTTEIPLTITAPSGPAGLTPVAGLPFQVSVLGDVNGDGADDLGIISPRLYHDAVNDDVPGVSIIFGDQSPASTVPVIDAVVLGAALSGSLSRLGDLDDDGYDEFAIARERDVAGEDQSGLLVFAGQSSYRDQPTSLAVLGQDDALLRINRSEILALPSGSSIDGAMLASAGDLNGNGKPDLVLATPFYDVLNSNGVVLQRERQGQTRIFYDVADAASVIATDQADQILLGTNLRDEAGYLSPGPLVDLDRDGLADFFVNAPYSDSLLNGFTLAAGRSYLVSGGRLRVPIAANGNLTAIENRRGQLTDSQTGRPLQFDDLLLDGDETWVRFTTAGDGAETSGVSDFIRIVSEVPLQFDLVAADGGLIAVGKSLMDLRNLVAGTFFMRVHPESGTTLNEPVAFSIETDPPQFGLTTGVDDRDVIRGGPGDDRVSGDQALDRLFGGPGNDILVGALVEVFDLETGEQRIDPALSDPTHARLVPATDRAVLDGPGIADEFRRLVAQTLGHPVTVDANGDSVYHQPIYASEMAEIQELRLTAQASANLTGLEQAINLRVLDASGLELTEFNLPIELPKLEVLDLSGNQLISVSEETLDHLPGLQHLVLDDNPITDLHFFTGTGLIDDGDVGFELTGEWETITAAPAESQELATALQDDYRIGQPGERAIWRFEATGETEVFVTWPSLPDLDSRARYTVADEAKGFFAEVDQSIPPGGGSSPLVEGGRTWFSLGKFTPASNRITILLEGLGDSVAIADAVRIESSPPTLPAVEISVLGNEIDAFSRDELVDQIERDNPGASVVLDENDSRPLIRPMDSGSLRHRALDFDDSIIQLPHTLLDGKGSFMMEFWTRLDGVQTSATFLSVANAANNNELLFEYQGQQSTSSVTVMQVWDGGVEYEFIFNGINLNDGQWHHVALVRDIDVDLVAGQSKLLAVIIDGQHYRSAGLPDSAGPLQVDPSGIVIGQDQDTVGGTYQSTQSLDGQLDEVVFWDRFWDDTLQDNERARIQRQILITKDEALFPQSSNMLAYYNFDSADAAAVIDATANGLDGMLGDSIGTGSNARPAPTRVSNVPVTVETSLFPRLLDGGLFDADGDLVTITATSDDPDVITTMLGSTLQVQYQANISADALITVVASDGRGRESRTQFYWTVDGLTPTEVPGLVTSQQIVFGTVTDESGDPVVGANVNLYHASGAAMLTTVTDHAGQYRMAADLAAGVDRVELAVTEKWTSTPASVDVSADSNPGFSYEFNVDPGDPDAIDLDGNGQPDFGRNFTPAGGFDPLTSSITFVGESGSTAFLGQNGDSDGVWSTVAPTVASGFTLDFAVQVIDDPATPELGRGSFGVIAARSDSITNVLMFVKQSQVVWRQNDQNITLSTADNTDRDHHFRVIAVPGIASQFYIWRDGVLLNAEAPLDGTDITGFPDRLVVGNLGGGDGGVAKLDQLGFYKGLPFHDSPAPEEVDFIVSRTLDAGPDRIVSEGESQVLTAASNLALTDVVWTVTLDGNAVATGSGSSFEFTPTDEGVYAATVTANDGATALSDNMQLFVSNVAPSVTITSNTMLPIAEGSTIEISAIVSDAAGDSIESYRWVVLNADGVEVDSLSATAPIVSVNNWLLSFGDEGIYRVFLEVTDNDGAVGVSDAIVLDIANVDPNLSTNLDANDQTGSLVVTGSFGDPGDDFHLAMADFGDGTRRPITLEGTPNFSIEHQYESPGTYQVTITVDDQDGGTSQRTFEVNYRPQLAVEDIVVNGGDTGRSKLGSVQVFFDQIVDVNKSAFVLRNRDTGKLLRSFTVDIDHQSGSSIAQLDFLPQVAGANSSAIPDGNYELVISSAGVQPIENAIERMATDLVFGDDSNDAFFQLYGDSDGDRDVDLSDFRTIAQSLGTALGDPGFDAALDSDGDADIDGIDFGQFRRRLSQFLPYE